VTWSTALRLGRVSNLPTVWTNALAGVVLAGGAVSPWLAVVVLAMTLFYAGGMFLNDFFDREIDARQRPERPIPAGEAGAATVALAGGGMLVAAVCLLAWAAYGFAAGDGWRATAMGAVLAVTIVFYDWRHKGNPLAPVVMGACRALIYLGAGLVFVAAVPMGLIFASLALLCYVAGLTYAAKQESLNRVEALWPLAVLAAPIVYTAQYSDPGPTTVVLWLCFLAWVGYALSFLVAARRRDVPRAVAFLLAGISLLDAVLIAGAGAPALAWLAAAGFALTLALQRVVPAT
jgi:4-hydroxybenzoate polyprenyltransferase